ncbi:Signal transduction histidine kinase [Alteribacillus persepolensis]|uniref:histidine kinase n=1 Tax=Alteribacillus persepolensis TaxID=568899 RepID=A0A1G8AAD9_9BACI|nr:HAMP domain-containing sensor histidine kinase [Alteribacillus persepolensis]SDH17859.1 Signal transduction histidine kinase [Alteribacillus persepolensis]
MNKNRKISLLRYWTTRYFVTLVIGLVIVAVISVLWIRHTNLENRLNVTIYLAQEIADRFIEENEGRTVPREGVDEYIQQRQNIIDTELDPIIYIVDVNGRILANPFNQETFTSDYFPVRILEVESDVQRLKLENGMQSYIVKRPIQTEGVTAGWVVIIQSASQLTQMNEEFRLLAIMLATLALIGWATIYVLSKKLSEPIQDVAQAAKHVQEQNYDFSLPEHNIREQEVHELVHSFKEMSLRLQQLESLRSELLAGVTHELKTPITSMTGLIQAVRDDVVEGEEAKEFLDVSLKEANRMKTMVADLLEFNSFAADAIPITLETYDVNKLAKEILHQWEIVNDEEGLTIQHYLPEENIEARVDSIRLQQILVNLMNNAKHALNGEGVISITVERKRPGVADIHIEDNGPGIQEEEQALIFERFYRGENKKYNTHGLGLGLPFSKMIAQSMHGDLLLTESRPGRTVFTLELPCERNEKS